MHLTFGFKLIKGKFFNAFLDFFSLFEKIYFLTGAIMPEWPRVFFSVIFSGLYQ